MAERKVNDYKCPSRRSFSAVSWLLYVDISASSSLYGMSQCISRWDEWLFVARGSSGCDVLPLLCHMILMLYPTYLNIHRYVPGNITMIPSFREHFRVEHLNSVICTISAVFFYPFLSPSSSSFSFPASSYLPPLPPSPPSLPPPPSSPYLPLLLPPSPYLPTADWEFCKVKHRNFSEI